MKQLTFLFWLLVPLLAAAEDARDRLGDTSSLQDCGIQCIKKSFPSSKTCVDTSFADGCICKDNAPFEISLGQCLALNSCVGVAFGEATAAVSWFRTYCSSFSSSASGPSSSRTTAPGAPPSSRTTSAVEKAEETEPTSEPDGEEAELPSTADTPTSRPSKKGTSAGVKAGIAIGVMAGMALLGALVYLLRKNNALKKQVRGDSAEKGTGLGPVQGVYGRAEVVGDSRFPPQEIDGMAMKNVDRVRSELPGDQMWSKGI